jgi:hypothetical protein
MSKHWNPEDDTANPGRPSAVEDDDVHGHKIFLQDDDVEGHKVFVQDDDVEGHETV